MPASLTRRKPDPRFFQLALDRLGVRAEETVFLDDIGHNLAAAAKMGIRTIRKSLRATGLDDKRAELTVERYAGVNLGRSREALEELERVLGMSLLTSRAEARVEAKL